MIGHMMLWKYWMQSRQRAGWARETETLRAIQRETSGPFTATPTARGAALLRKRATNVEAMKGRALQ